MTRLISDKIDLKTGILSQISKLSDAEKFLNSLKNLYS